MLIMRLGVPVRPPTQMADVFCTNDRCSQLLRTGRPRFIARVAEWERLKCDNCHRWADPAVAQVLVAV